MDSLIRKEEKIIMPIFSHDFFILAKFSIQGLVRGDTTLLYHMRICDCKRSVAGVIGFERKINVKKNHT